MNRMADAGAEADHAIAVVVAAVSHDADGDGRPIHLHLDNGSRLRVHQVVLAFGHLAPKKPLSAEEEAAAGDAYVHDPWRADALSGIARDATVLLVGRDGHAVPWLHYIGPLLRAVHWEATAVPELRVHAARLAQHVSAPAPRPAQAAQPTATIA